MILYALRILRDQPFRLGFTVGGIALCIVLILFLAAVYRGVREGSIDYIRANEADLWVLQGSATNILRGSSILLQAHGSVLENVEGVETVAPVFFLLSSVTIGERASTVYLTGFESRTGLGGPPRLAGGRIASGEGEIVLDRSFARRFGLVLDDTVRIRNQTLRVVGLSEGTNMFVIQYAFVTLEQARNLAGYPGLVTCFLVRLKDPADCERVRADVREDFDDLEVFTHDEFLANNIREMESGFLPLLLVLALLGAVVLTIILSLILSMNILERRNDFAVLKALGSPRRTLRVIVMAQAFILGWAGSLAGFVAIGPLAGVVETLAPEVSTRIEMTMLGATFGSTGLMNLLSSWIALRRIRSVYPLEVFR